ncbi:hypothetical protein JXA47_03770 [Candidatus Sumerlaeota bacterium]|nr:hypothetical protein [Candidatus Sumerlaeota bacterium]
MIRILSLAGVIATLATAALAAVPLPERAPEPPEVDLSFLRDRIPASALVTEPGSDNPAVVWDHDGDGYLELRAQWDDETEEFTQWTFVDPVTEQPVWRLEVSDWRERPWRLTWDANGDGLMDWIMLDADRDDRPEEILWDVGSEATRAARFLDRDGDGVFEVRCWIDLTESESPWGEGRVWAFDDDGDGNFDRRVDGAQRTQSGYDPDEARAMLEEDPNRVDLLWDLIGWSEVTGDEETWRDLVLAYAAHPEGNSLYRLLYRPIMRRMFHTDRSFRARLIETMRERCDDRNAEYVTLWALGELLRWASTPPRVHPWYLEDWRREIGLPDDVELPTEVDAALAAEAGDWFRRSLACESVSSAARTNVAMRLATVHAAQGDWAVADALGTTLIGIAQRIGGPISRQHLEYADICFVYGNVERASELYGAMAAHWEAHPGDPQRAEPNHIALIRLGIMAEERGIHRRARYFLLRALDSLTPAVKTPDRRLAEHLLANEETREAATEYLEAIEALAAAD